MTVDKPAYAWAVERAFAKLNLCLHVVGVRQDGYHLLQGLTAFTRYGDTVRFSVGDKKAGITFTIVSIDNTPLALTSNHDNLCVRAGRLFEKLLGHSIDVHMTLYKRLPISSGIGGGSADAGAVLRGLNKLYGSPFTLDTLAGASLSLGADVPMCVYSQSSFIEGVGEKVTPLREEMTSLLKGSFVLLVNPRVPVSTPDIFKRLPCRWNEPVNSVVMNAGHSTEQSKESVGADVLTMIQNQTRNDLQETACQLVPVIRDVLEKLSQMQGVSVKRMSGSGATCFAVFQTKADCHQAESILRFHFPLFWIQSTQLL